MSTTQVDPALIAMFDRNMVEFYVQSRSRPWADIRIDDDVVWGSTGLPLQAFNGALARRSATRRPTPGSRRSWNTSASCGST